MQVSSSFWNTVEENRKIVAKWPKWMQDITITAETAKTGQFIKGVSDESQ